MQPQGQGEQRGTDTHSSFAPPGGLLFLLPSPKPTPGPRSEGQVSGIKQCEGPVLAEE
uniref:Alternative protein LOC100131738 n=1 Tax=Homo sapiens TaxID=9606 RepID=L8E9E7_HUMAN|nr:alternative protein LOC100131738 [Homo sapiens]